jgi:threonine-phosphate decarboxylase
LLKLKHTDFDAWKLKDMLIEKGILIRTSDGFKGLSPYHFRLAVKDRVSNDRLINALKEVTEIKYENT